MEEALLILTPRALGSWTTWLEEPTGSSRGRWLLTSDEERCGPVFTLCAPGAAGLFLDELSGGRRLGERELTDFT